MRLLIVNGPLIGSLGKRNPKIYGNKTYKDLVKELNSYAKEKNISLTIKQSNSESKIVSFLESSYNKYDGLIINPAAYTHYSYAIRDAVEFLSVKTVEVHISDVYNREEFRKISVIEDLADKRIVGKGIEGYKEAIDFFKEV